MNAEDTVFELLMDALSRPWVVVTVAVALGLALLVSLRLIRVRPRTRVAVYALAALVCGFFAMGGHIRWEDWRDKVRRTDIRDQRTRSEEAAKQKTFSEQVHAIRASARLPARVRLLRLSATGAIDPTFSADGFAGWDSIRGILVQPDGRVLVAGYIDYLLDGPDPKIAHAVVRLLPDGRPDEPFIARASQLTDYANWVALGAEGRILLGLGSSNVPVARLLPTGDLDKSFKLPAAPRSPPAPPPTWPVLRGSGEALEQLYAADFLAQFDLMPQRATLLPDGKLLVQGRFTSAGPDATPSGSARFMGRRLDATFVPEPTPWYYEPVPLADGSLIALGYRSGTVVMGPDGHVDATRSEALARSLSECGVTLELAAGDDRGGFFAAGKSESGRTGSLAHFTLELVCDHVFTPVLRGTAVTALAPLPGGGVLVATYP